MFTYKQGPAGRRGASVRGASAGPAVKRKPAGCLTGEKDGLVKSARQEKMIEQLKQLNGVGSKGKPAGKQATGAGPGSKPVVVMSLSPNGLAHPPEAAGRIVQFFKSHPARRWASGNTEPP